MFDKIIKKETCHCEKYAELLKEKYLNKLISLRNILNIKSELFKKGFIFDEHQREAFDGFIINIIEEFNIFITEENSIKVNK